MNLPESDARACNAASRPAFYDARQILALTPYVIGAMLWCLAAGLLILGDKIGGSRHSEHLI